MELEGQELDLQEVAVEVVLDLQEVVGEVVLHL